MSHLIWIYSVCKNIIVVYRAERVRGKRYNFKAGYSFKIVSLSSETGSFRSGWCSGTQKLFPLSKMMESLQNVSTHLQFSMLKGTFCLVFLFSHSRAWWSWKVYLSQVFLVMKYASQRIVESMSAYWNFKHKGIPLHPLSSVGPSYHI